MTKNFYLSPLTKDLTVEDYQLKLTSTKSEWLSQSIENEFKTFFGEWFVNQTLGLPYYEKILGKGVDVDEINSIYINRLKAREEIEQILEFVVTYDENIRKYNISFIVLIIDNGESVQVEGGFTI
jgi:hypothetical protein